MRVHHIALRVTDCLRSAAFYSGVLGLSEVRRAVDGGLIRAVWLQAGDTVLMLEAALRGAGAESGSGHLIAFAIDDLNEWERRLKGAGLPVVDRTPHTLYVSDPDGHRVGLTVFGTVAH
jgi:catechol 2,3-dioxygenase-like lactoylglutathione lyase family enzyme